MIYYIIHLRYILPSGVQKQVMNLFLKYKYMKLSVILSYPSEAGNYWLSHWLKKHSHNHEISIHYMLFPMSTPPRVQPSPLPAVMARERASTLSPILRTVSGDGPMNSTPASAHAWAKSDRSERKP